MSDELARIRPADPRDTQMVGDDRCDDRSYFDDLLGLEEPRVSPAVDHARWTRRPWTAAAIHILDHLDTPMFDRGAVSMSGIEWDRIIRASDAMSSGEQALVAAAYDLDETGQITGTVDAHLRARVDPDLLEVVAQARRIATESDPL